MKDNNRTIPGCEVIRMKKLYCMNCGVQIKGGIPNECSCGAEFDLADTKNIKKIITSIIFFVILMSPLIILITLADNIYKRQLFYMLYSWF